MGKQGDAQLACEKHIWEGKKTNPEPARDLNIHIYNFI